MKQGSDAVMVTVRPKNQPIYAYILEVNTETYVRQPMTPMRSLGKGDTLGPGAISHRREGSALCPQQTGPTEVRVALMMARPELWTSLLPLGALRFIRNEQVVAHECNLSHCATKKA